MAATVSAWSKPGAWALDSEEHEDELIQESVAAVTAAASNSRRNVSNGGGDTADFPSLAAAASTKTKKKKPQTLSLGEFYSADQKKFQANKGLTIDEQLMLPTGPRQRTADEMDRPGIGGGFRSYGSGDRSDSSSRWGSDRGEEGGRGRGRGSRDRERDDGPSRADEIDDWGAAKKSSIGGGGGGFERRERGERGGFFSDSQSRADDSDNWGSNKSFTPLSDGGGRRYGGGFDRERRSGGGFELSNGNGADSDSWGRKKEDDGRRYGAFDSLRERRGGSEMNGGASAAESWGKKSEEGIGGGSGRPKLNLQPRKLPVGEIEVAPVVAAKASKGSNPFGDARPREQVLKEKGQDWKEIDEKLESTKLKETDGPALGKKGFGGGNGRVVGAAEERTWRKNENIDARPPSSSGQISENGATEETEERGPEV